MHILGLNAFHADASAALLRDGDLLAAVEEERLTRVKHCAGFPTRAAREVLAVAGVDARGIDHVAISRDPAANLARKLAAVAAGRAPLGLAVDRLRNAARVARGPGLAAHLAEALGPTRAKLHAVEHHRAHLASAFFASPFEEAAVLSVDGFGDFVSTMFAHGRGRRLEVLGEIGFPHSIGVLYTATCQWLGFDRYGDEGKVMGLAPYGRPRHLATLARALALTDEGFRLDPAWFTHTSTGARMTWEAGAPTIERLFSDRFVAALGPARRRGEPLDERHHDVAASLQALTEEAVVHLARLVHRRTASPRLCVAGGVALNSVANGKLRGRTPFAEIYVQPAAGDNGTSLGAALYVAHHRLGVARGAPMISAATGPAFPPDRVEAALARAALSGVRITRLDDERAFDDRVAALLDGGAVVGWFQGRMEFGPRALGHRSVLADPRRAEMKDVLNRRVKHREPFRPFAPAILAERTGEWFLDAQPSPAMLMVLPFRPERRAEVPAVVHVDGSGRLQTVDRDGSPRFHALLSAFERRTGVPILLNTSFNENEPIVCAPDEAVACFARTAMDALAIGPFLVERRVGPGPGT